MNKTKRHLLALAAVICMVIGLGIAVPSMLNGNYLNSTLSTMVVVAGLVFLAISFGDE